MPLAFVEDQPDKPVYKPVHVYSSARAERSFQVMTDTPSKPVNVYSSTRAEKAFNVMTDTPSKAVNVYSSSRAENNFEVMDGTPSKAVSVFNSRLAEGHPLPPFVQDKVELQIETSKANEREWFSEAWAMLCSKEESPLDLKGTLLASPQRLPTAEPCPELSPTRRRGSSPKLVL